MKPTTYLSYEIHVGRHINPVLGNMPLQKLSGAAINAFYARLLTEPRKPVLQPRRSAKEDGAAKDRLRKERRLKPQPEPEKQPEPLSRLSIRKIHATLHKAFADAVRWNRLVRNPADAADPPKTRSGVMREMKTWTAKELQAFLTTQRESRLYPLWLILASTGMRRGEALGLRWEDVDTDNSRLSIRQNLVTVGYVVHIGKPKTGRGRNVSVDPATLAVLKAYHKHQLEEKILWKKAGYVDSGFVFRRENGLPYHPDSVSRPSRRRSLPLSSPHPAPRSPAHPRHVGPSGRHPSQGGIRTARARQHQHHPRCVLARHPRHGGRSGRQDRGPVHAGVDEYLAQPGGVSVSRESRRSFAYRTSHSSSRALSFCRERVTSAPVGDSNRSARYEVELRARASHWG